MKPAVKSKKLAMITALVVGGFTLWWYFSPFWWLGVIMGLVAGLFTYFILNSRRMERYRRVYFISLFLIASVSLIIVIADMGTATFLDWAQVHEKEYYLPGQAPGTLTYPCTRDVPQLLMGRAYFIRAAAMKSIAAWGLWKP